MKLLTHNFLQCHVKGVKNGYPLKIEAVQIEVRDADYDPGVRQHNSAARLVTESVRKPSTAAAAAGPPGCNSTDTV